jgi:hypothetical protein
MGKVAEKCSRCSNSCKMEAYLIVDKCADFVPKKKKEPKEEKQ